MREHVVAAAHAMETGNWKACKDYITSIKVPVDMLVLLNACFSLEETVFDQF